MTFTPENADLLAGQQQGYGVIENNTASQIGRIKEMMGRYGSGNDAYLQKMTAAQMRAQAAAKLRLDARLADSQLRSRMHEFKLKMLQDAYKQQKKDSKRAMWATALGSAAQVGGGIAGMATPSYDYSNGGPLAGESYMDLSGIMRTQG
jgi:hypothetical protein